MEEHIFIEDLRKAINDDTYDEFLEKYEMDEWEIIEELLSRIK